VFRHSQTASQNIAIVTDGRVKNNNVATSIAHIWKENIVVDCLKAQTMKSHPSKPN